MISKAKIVNRTTLQMPYYIWDIGESRNQMLQNTMRGSNSNSTEKRRFREILEVKLGGYHSLH